jgi:predicted nucleic acid-binding protein
VKLVIDASVAVKWFVGEARHELARDVLRDGILLAAPDLLLVEVANALRNKVRTKIIQEPQAKAAIRVLPEYFERLVRPSGSLAEAFDLACRLNHPVADCVYLVCALEDGTALLTDDEKLFKKARALPNLHIVLLQDWQPNVAVAPKR